MSEIRWAHVQSIVVISAFWSTLLWYSFMIPGFSLRFCMITPPPPTPAPGAHGRVLRKGHGISARDDTKLRGL